MNIETMSGLVSVVIPTYNRSRYLGDAVQSILDDPYPLKEIVIIDDGSVDDTQHVVENLQSRSTVLIRYVYINHAGGGAARNLGMSLSQGEYLLFLDSDDFLINEKISTSIGVFQELPHVQVVYSDWYVKTKDGAKTVAHADHKNVLNIIEGTFNYFTFGMTTTSPVWRKSFLTEHNLRWDTNLICWQDVVFEFRALVQLGSPEKIRHLSEPLFVYRYEGQGSMGSHKYSEPYLLSELRAYHILYAECRSRGRDLAIQQHYRGHLRGLLYRSLLGESKRAWMAVLKTLRDVRKGLKVTVLTLIPFEVLLICKRIDLLFQGLSRKAVERRSCRGSTLP